MVVLRGDLLCAQGRVEEWCRASQDRDWTRVPGSVTALLYARDAPFARPRCIVLFVYGISIAHRRHCYRERVSVMEYERQKRADDDEMISDQELWSVIRYLDPETEGRAGDFAVILITLLVIASMVCFVWFLFHLRGL